MASVPQRARKTRYPGGKSQSTAAKKGRKYSKTKDRISKEVNARPEQKKKRAEANKARREAIKRGKRPTGDASHKNGRISGFKSRAKNRDSSKERRPRKRK